MMIEWVVKERVIFKKILIFHFHVTVPRGHFQRIFWLLHVSHTSSFSPHNASKKFYKVKNFLHVIISKFQSISNSAVVDFVVHDLNEEFSHVK